VLVREGILFCKITDYVHNHRYQWAHVDLINAGQGAGFTACDCIVKVRKGPIIDPKWKRAHHSRRQHCFQRLLARSATWQCEQPTREYVRRRTASRSSGASSTWSELRMPTVPGANWRPLVRAFRASFISVTTCTGITGHSSHSRPGATRSTQFSRASTLLEHRGRLVLSSTHTAPASTADFPPHHAGAAPGLPSAKSNWIRRIRWGVSNRMRMVCLPGSFACHPARSP